MVRSQGQAHWKHKWSPNNHKTNPLQNDGRSFSLTSPFRPSSSLAFTALNDSSILFSFLLFVFVCKRCFFRHDNQWQFHSSFLPTFPNPPGFLLLLLLLILLFIHLFILNISNKPSQPWGRFLLQCCPPNHIKFKFFPVSKKVILINIDAMCRYSACQLLCLLYRK